jgi:hypothetical protein
MLAQPRGLPQSVQEARGIVGARALLGRPRRVLDPFANVPAFGERIHRFLSLSEHLQPARSR